MFQARLPSVWIQCAMTAVPRLYSACGAIATIAYSATSRLYPGINQSIILNHLLILNCGSPLNNLPSTYMEYLGPNICPLSATNDSICCCIHLCPLLIAAPLSIKPLTADTVDPYLW